MSSSEYSASERSDSEASIRGEAKKKKSGGPRGKKEKKSKSNTRDSGKRTGLDIRQKVMWEGRWNNWGTVIREKRGMEDGRK